MIHCPSQCSPALHGYRRSHVTQQRAAVAHFFPKKMDGPRQHRTLCPRPRATPELDAILGSPLVPGSPAATGNLSSLIPVSALMLLFYFVSNFIVPEIVMKDLQSKAEKEAAAESPPPQLQQQEDVVEGQINNVANKLELKVKQKRSRKAKRA